MEWGLSKTGKEKPVEMKEWKKGIKLLEYGTENKVYIIFLGLGILMLVQGGNWEIGAFLLTMGLLQPLGWSSNLEWTGMVAASPKKKMLCLSIPEMVICVGGWISYFLIVVINWLNICLGGKSSSMEEKEGLLKAFFVLFLVLSWGGIAYKRFKLGIILGVGSLIVIEELIRFVSRTKWIGEVDRKEVYLIGLALALIGIILSVVLRRALYHLPVSKLISPDKQSQ